MMEQEWAAILARFGQEVTLTAPEGEPVAVRAFVQPILDRQPQLVQCNKRCVTTDHEDITMGEVEHLCDSIYHRVAEGDDRVDRA